MEKNNKRIAAVLITVKKDSPEIFTINKTLGEFSSEIISRQGLSLPSKSFNIISIIIDSDVNTINALAGKIGKFKDADIKTLIK